MKICIVTVYNSINSGSFWQARALGYILKQLGAEVVYLKRKNTIDSSSSKIKQIVALIKIFFTKGKNEAKRRYKTYKEFEKSQEVFHIIQNKEIYFKDIDLFVIGSDTVWNLDSNFFEKNYKIFFGGIFRGKDVISYAASVANTSIDKIKNHKDIPEMLDNMKGISVRDEKTYKIAKELSKKDVKIVCDPTMLLSKEDYINIENTRIEKDKYILMYLFQDLSKEQIQNVKEFASENKLKVINILNTSKWCDKNIVNTPNNFLNYMLYADYVITDTFHGTIFSANLEKNFITINRNKNKVNDFLEKFNLKNRLINSSEKISNKFRENIDYASINELISKFKEESIGFLKKYI